METIIHIRHMFCPKCQKSTPHHIKKKLEYSKPVGILYSCITHTSPENKLAHQTEVPNNEYYLLMADLNHDYRPVALMK